MKLKKKKHKVERVVFLEDAEGLALLKRFYERCAETECFSTFLRNVLHQAAQEALVEEQKR